MSLVRSTDQSPFPSVNVSLPLPDHEILEGGMKEFDLF